MMNNSELIETLLSQLSTDQLKNELAKREAPTKIAKSGHLSEKEKFIASIDHLITKGLYYHGGGNE